MIRTTFTAAALAFAAAFTSAPSQAEIIKAECKLSKYGDSPLTEIFPCEFRQSAGNAQIWSKNWNFEFLAVDQGKTYVRINSNPLSFHRLGKYSLFVFQNGMPAQEFERGSFLGNEMVHPIWGAQPAVLCQVGQTRRFSCDKLNGHTYGELFALTKPQAGIKILMGLFGRGQQSHNHQSFAI